jgi:cytoskeleton protein RodZ
MTANAAEDIGSVAGREAPGALLREARLAQNLGVPDVARQLKLSITQVEALEAGDFERLPGPVFVRGFIRNYARLLRLDAEPLLNSVAGNLPKEEPRPAAPPSQDIPFPTAAPRRWHRYALILAAIVAVLAAYEYFPGESEPAVKNEAAQVPQPVAAPEASSNAAAVPEAAPQASAPAPADEPKVEAPARPGTGQPAPQAGSSAATQSAPQVAASAPATPDMPPPAAKGTVREEEPAPAPGERQVRMVFEQESWVEIRDRSGKAIFSQLNPPGTEQRVNGRPPLAVVVGNAHGVRLTYDERPVNLTQHTKVDVARLTLQ